MGSGEEKEQRDKKNGQMVELDDEMKREEKTKHRGGDEGDKGQRT